MDAALDRISGTTDLDAAVSDADLVVEAVPEDMDLKQDVVEDVAASAPDDALIASNTSSLSVTEMAEKSSVALELAKSAIRQSSRVGLDACIDHESELFVQLFATDGKNEGIDAFLDGRDPEFTGE